MIGFCDLSLHYYKKAGNVMHICIMTIICTPHGIF